MKRLKKAAHHTYSGSLSVIAWSVFLCLVLLIAARLLFSSGPYFKGWLESRLTELAGQSVHIGELDTVWNGWKPQLELSDVRVEDAEGGPGFRFSSLFVDLDLERVLTHSRLEIGLIRLVGVDLSLERLQDGRLVLSGLPEDPGTAGSVGLPQWLFRIRHIGVSDSRLTWQNHQTGRPALHFENVDLQFQSTGRQHYLRGGMDLPGSAGGHLELAADLAGPGTDLQRWGGQLYLRARQLDVPGLMSLADALPLNIIGGRLDAELWGDWRETRLKSAQVNVTVRDAVVARPGDSGRVHIAQLRGGVRWLDRDDGWQLRMGLDEVRVGADHWPLTRLDVDFGKGGEYRLAADRLRVQDLLSALTEAGFVAGELRETLSGVQPRALVENLRLQTASSNSPLRYDFQLRDLHTRPWRRLPGLGGASARIQGDLHGGVIHLDSAAGNFEAPRLFVAPLVVKRVSARLFWHRGAEGDWRILAPDISLANDELSALGYVRIDHPDEGEPWLEILANFDGPGAGRVPPYLPQRVFSADLNHWLDNAFRGGRAEAGQFLYYGPMHGFPVPHEGWRGDSVFEVRAECRDVDLHFADGWPDLNKVDGLLVFRDAGMEVDVHDIKIDGARFRHGYARIVQLGAKPPVLKVKARANVGLVDGFAYLDRTPVRERFEPVTGRMEVRGHGELDLALDIPLRKGGHVKVAGALAMEGAQLRLPEPALVFSKLSGILNFTENGLNVRGATARIAGQTMRFDLDGGEARSNVRIHASGRTTVDELKSQVKLKSLEHLDGRFSWHADFEVEPRQGRVTMLFRSDMLGTAVNLPAPFRKSYLESRPLTIQGAYSAGRVEPLQVAYGPDISAFVLADASGRQPEQLVFRFGGAVAGRADRPGLYVIGQLDELSLDPWLAVMEAAEYGPDWPPLQQVDLKVGNLGLLQRSWRGVELRAERGADGLVGLVDSAAVAGSFRVPDRVSKLGFLELNLSRFYWPDTNESEPDLAPGGLDDPRRSAPLKLQIGDLRIGKVDLGSLRVVTEHIDTGQKISLLDLTNAEFSISGGGSWEMLGNQSVSNVTIHLRARTLSGLLRRFGYSSAIEGANTALDGNLSWLGAPRDFSLAGLKGNIDLEIGEGQFLDLEPGVGRMFGLFSLDTILRRLRLDFRDLFGKGYSFDRIQGQLSVAGGDLFTDDFVMAAPSSRVEVAGRLGLIAEDYDERVKVIPRLMSTLPLAGVLTGGATLGGALLVAQALLGEKVDKILEIDYRVTGPWTAPVVERQGVPETSIGPAAAPADPADF